MNAELVKGTEEDLERFITSNPMQQLDTETNVTEHYTLRELYVIQLGTYAADRQHIDVKDMSTGVDKLLRKLFADKEIVFLAHNAKFEYIIIQTFRNIRKEF
jgi:UDP-glucose 6-dehydrogenase